MEVGPRVDKLPLANTEMSDTFEVIPASAGDEALYSTLGVLKTRDLGHELWLSVGGWDFSSSGFATATTFSDLVTADITYQNVFSSSLTLFMMTWGLTGVDIEWPAALGNELNLDTTLA